MTRGAVLVLALLLAGAAASVAACGSPAARGAGASTPVQAQGPRVDGRFILFFTKAPADVEAAIGRADDGRRARLGAGLRVSAVNAVEEPLGRGVFEMHNRGLSDDEIGRAAKATHSMAWRLEAAGPAAHERLKLFHQLVVDAATELDAFIWDAQAMIGYTPTLFREIRLADWIGETPPAIAFLAAPAIGTTDAEASIVTVGMGTFALPELEISRLAATVEEPGRMLLIMAAQLLIERGAVPASGVLVIEPAKIANLELREFFLAYTTPAARVTVKLVKGPSRLEREIFLIQPPDGAGSVSERQYALYDALFDTSDQIEQADAEDAELLAARDRARAQLPKIRLRFAKGLPRDQRLIVKAPFATPDGTPEWMWVEVQSWTPDGAIGGVLISPPNDVPGLEQGARVTVREADLFDWIIFHRDDTSEGGETNLILERRQRGE